MKFYPLEHRSEEWHGKRRGMPTASQFGRIITPAGKPSSQAALYEAELIAERIFNAPVRRDISNLPAVRHGIETEPEAAEMLAGMIGTELAPGGFLVEDDGRFGCSPDRIVVSGNRKECCELKCPFEVAQHIKTLLFGPDDMHRAQVQGQLLISGYDGCHFLSFHRACPPKYVYIQRDETFIRALQKVLTEFCERLDADHQRALKMGAWGIL